MAQSTSVPSQRPRVRMWLLVAAFLFTQMVTVSAFASDPVLEWMAITGDSAIASGTSPFVTSRVVSLVSASVFDAVNGIEPRYRPLHVRPHAPRHASAGAAAVQAAYAMPMLDPICAALAFHRAVAHREYHQIPLTQLQHFHARLHARTLFGHHELAACKIAARLRQ